MVTSGPMPVEGSPGQRSRGTQQRCDVCGRRPQDPWPHHGYLCGHCDDYSTRQAAHHLIDGLGVILGPVPVEIRGLLRELLDTDALPIILMRLLEWEDAANGR
jgi:hypothetical protein